MLLQLHIGTLARGLGSAMTGYQRGKREEEDYQRQAELEMLRQKLLTQQFTTAERAGKFAEAAERRAQERHQQQLDEAARKQQELEEDRARRIALGQHIRETGAFAGTPGADAELWARAAEAGELDLGDILTYYGRQRAGGGANVRTATNIAATEARALRDLYELAINRARTRWRQLTGGIFGGKIAPRDPKTGKELTLADVEQQELARLEQEQGYQPGDIMRALTDLARTASFDLRLVEPGEGTTGPTEEGGEANIEDEAGTAALQRAFRGQDAETVRQILAAEGFSESEIAAILGGI